LHQNLNMKRIKLQVNETKRYIKLKRKFNNDNFLTNKINETIKLFEEDETNPELHFKPITCKKDKNRHSIRVINTDYRILMTIFPEYVDLFCICNHDK